MKYDLEFKAKFIGNIFLTLVKLPQVRLVRERYTGCVYAMKTLNKAATLDQDASAFFENERNIMANGSSPWLTALEYAFQDQENLYLVMEFHPGGDLLSLLTRQESQTVSAGGQGLH